MLDLGTSFLASVARDPGALAIVDGATRLTYADWFKSISAVTFTLQETGLVPGDHVVSLLQNRWEAATLHWACQFAGLIITPLNWRATAEDAGYAITDSQARLVVYEAVSAFAIDKNPAAAALPHLTVGLDAGPDAIKFERIAWRDATPAEPRAQADDMSLMLYTSGTTAKPKGVPRRHRTERAAAIAHIAQNLYARQEQTLGVMPLYHTMGVRSLLAMSLIGGTFVCLPRFSVEDALRLIESEHVTNLYLVPTLYHDLIHHAAFTPAKVASVRKLGFAGAPMTDALLNQLADAFRPDLFVNHYGSSEVYTFTINQDAAHKPGSAGRAGLNTIVRVVPFGAAGASTAAAPGEEGEIAVIASGDEAFEGYWRRPDADAKAFRDGWYFTGDTGYADADGDIFVTGRVDDMIITGGENVSPVEIESCLSLHPAVSEVVVAGCPDERWGKVVTAFIKRKLMTGDTELDAYCRAAGLPSHKRPRRYVFVDSIPKSPVGKLLRRSLVQGDYLPETLSSTPPDVPVSSPPALGNKRP